MAAFLGNLRNVVIAGFVLAILAFLLLWKLSTAGGGELNGITIEWALLRYLHIVCGVMWIGLLWYFNFVATPTMPKIPTELKPALGKFITPAALFWFRWGAMGTIVFGIILAWRSGYLIEAYTLDAVDSLGAFTNTKSIIIGIGMWLGTIMWFNVWFVIWPNQQKALNIDNKFPDLAQPVKDASAKTAGMFSRINTMLSIPMLFCMVAAAHLV
ncbi:MAG TPA: urate hydroxylase PuuD [Rhizomicrobium sp.]